MSVSNFQEKALSNRAAIPIISPTSNERQPVRQKLLDGRTVSVPGHQVATLSEQPVVTYINPITAIPTGAFQGGETFCDVELPNELHIITGVHANFGIQTQTKDSSGNVLAPTPAWFSRIEVYANGGKDLIETIWPEPLYNDAIAWRDITVLRDQADLLNVTSDVKTNDGGVSDGVNYSPSGDSSTPYQQSPVAFKPNSSMNLWCPVTCCLTQAKVFCAGFQGNFRFRFYFAPSIHVNSNGGSNNAPSLASFQLAVVTQTLSAVNFENQLRQHRNGQVLYKFVLKNRLQYPLSAVNKGSYNIQLRAFKSLSAGLLVSVTQQAWGNNPVYFQDRVPVASLQLLDSVGRRLTEVLPDAYIRRFIMPRHLNTQYPVFQHQYLLPFSSDFGETNRNATNLGYDQLTTLEQLVVVFPASQSAGGDAPGDFDAFPDGGNGGQIPLQVTVYSYDYASVVCNGGVGQVQFT